MSSHQSTESGPFLAKPFSAKLERLEALRAQMTDFIASTRAYIIKLDTDSPAKAREKMTTQLIAEAGHITGATTGHFTGGDEHRISAFTLNRNDEVFGASISCFTREFHEIEMEALSLRAMMLARIHNVGVENFGFSDIEPEKKEPDPRENLLLRAYSWDDVVRYIVQIHESGCKFRIRQSPYYNRSEVDEVRLYTHEELEEGEIRRIMEMEVDLKTPAEA